MIHVVDSIMGSGKSSSVINYINDNQNRKYIYITPYLDEAERIKLNCPSLNFVEPSDNIPDFNYSKTEHSMYLIQNSKNITSTHAMFRLYTREMCEAIRKNKYTLIVDESVDVFTETEYAVGDIKVLLDGEYVSFNDGVYRTANKPYTGDRLYDIFRMLKSNELIPVKNALYYWSLPVEVIESFEDIYILTYMFKSQDLYYYLKIHNIEFKNIGVKKDNDQYVFTDEINIFPEYIKHITELIHILDNDKLNSIGSRFHDISVNWFRRKENNSVDILKNNIYNYMQNYNREIPSDKKMWSTFKENKHYMRGKGYSSGYTVFNQKATNELRSKKVLSYLVNIFVSPDKINYFKKYNIEFDTEGYALSTMIQWIWRSAIRDGEEIWIYIPSSRMRGLLENWLSELSNGGE